MATIRKNDDGNFIDEVNDGGSLTGSDEIFALGGSDSIVMHRNTTSNADITDIVHGGDGDDALTLEITGGSFSLATGNSRTGYTGRYSEQQGNYAYAVAFDGIERFDLRLYAAATITAGDGADYVTSFVSGSTLNGGGGNDFIISKAGSVSADGGTGTDTLVLDYSAAGRTVHVDMPFTGSHAAGYSGTVVSDYNGTATFTNIENFRIYGNGDADTIITADGDDFVIGGGGNDYIALGKGNDAADGGDGLDRLNFDGSEQASGVFVDLTGETSDDRIYGFEAFGGTITGSAFADRLIEGTAASYDATFNMGAGNDLVQVSTGSDTVNGEGGTDTLVLDYSTTGRTVHIDQPLGGSLAGGYSGTYHSDTAATTTFSGIERFTVLGNGDADTIVTGDGDDTVSGGGGNDRIDVAGGANIADGGDGIDTLSIDLSRQAVGGDIDLSVDREQQSFDGISTVRHFENFGTITGSAQGDILEEGVQGTGSATLNMGGGDDDVTLSAGSDTIDGGAGTDILVLDFSQIGRTVHTATALSGSRAAGYSGAITSDNNGTMTFSGIEYLGLIGGGDNDELTTGDGDDLLIGNGGNDVLTAGAGSNTIDGGDNIDALGIDLSSQRVASTIDLRLAGAQASGGTNRVANVEGFTGTITGSAYGDTLIEQAGYNFGATFDMGAGNDTVQVGSGTDTVNGGGGRDRLVLDYSHAGRTAYNSTALSGSLATGYSGTFTSDNNGQTSFSGIEDFTITGSADFNDNDQLRTGDGNDVLSGNGGNDMIDAGGGANTVDGGGGGDRLALDLSGQTRGSTIDLTIGDGAQQSSGGTNSVRNFEAFGGTVTGSAFGDTLIEGTALAADATFAMGAGNDLVQVTLGNDTIDGGAGSDTLVVDASSAGRTVYNGTALSGSVAAGYSGSFRIDNAGSATFSGIENFRIYGSLTFGDGDAVTTGDGDDILAGRNGNDTLSAGGGNDLVLGGGDADTLDGGAGIDTVSYADIGGAVTVSLSIADRQDTGAGGSDRLAGFENLTGSAYADTLTGTGGANVLDGGAGADRMIGGGGDDSYYIDAAGDTISDSAGTDTIFSAIDYTIAANIENLYAADPAATTPLRLTGNAGANIIGGNAGDNLLTGGGGTDTVSYAYATRGVSVDLSATAAQATGGAGSDTLSGFANLTGSAFADTLSGDAGDNVLDGGGGIDTASYADARAGVTVNLATASPQATGDGTDTLLRFENLTGSAQGDRLGGSSGVNTIRGGDGDDVIDGGLGDDILDGGTGTDTVSYRSATAGVTVALDTVSAAAIGAAQTSGGGGADTISGFENIIGSAYADMLTGNGLYNVIDGGAGADTMIGGDGNDTYRVDDAGDRVVEDASQLSGIDRVFASVSYVLTAGSAVELLATDAASGTAAINLTGNALAQTVQGNAGANILNGGGGADTLAGFGGNDTYYVDTLADRVLEATGGGTDRVLASASFVLAAGQEIEQLATTGSAGTVAINLTGNDFAQTLLGNAGANVLNGGGGADTMIGYGGNDIYRVDNAGDRAIEAANGGSDTVLAAISYGLAAGQEIERLATTDTAGTAAINLTGNAFANLIQGNAGTNVLDGGGGADTLQGFGGDDLYYVDDAGDRVVEAANGGADRVLASVDYALSAGQAIEQLTTTSLAGTDAIDLTGNAFAQTIKGNAGDNRLNGGGGADTLFGYGGNDTYFVDNAADRVFEAAGDGTDIVAASVSYALATGQEIERLATTSAAGTGAIALTGNDIANTIQGNAGANAIDGKGGADILYGYGGADTFAFTTTLGGGNVDSIVDFANASNAVHDTIRLSRSVFTRLAAGGTLGAGAFKDITGGAATDADDRILYDRNSGALFYDADGSGSTAAVQFATLTNKAVLSSADFAVG